MEIVKATEEKKKYGIMSHLKEDRTGKGIDVDKRHLKGMREMKLHREYFQQRKEMVNIDDPKSDQWLTKAHLRFETESLLCAAQEQTLATKYMKAKIWGNGSDVKCRLCKEQMKPYNT